MTILVTGANGFVGRALVERLLRDGHKVVSITRDRIGVTPGSVIVYGDVRDQELLRRTLAEYAVDGIYHLAAQSIVSACSVDPVGALDVAVMGTARLLQAVRECERDIPCVVMTSDKVYGHSPPPYTETTPFRPLYAYEVSKACQDFVAQMFASNYQMRVCTVRSVNIYGPGDPNTSRLIPNTILRQLRREPAVLHDGASQMRRQYVYIDDIVEALLHVYDVLERRWKPDTAQDAPTAFCVGSPSPPQTAQEVVEALHTIVYGEPMASDCIRVVKREARFQEIQNQSVDGSYLAWFGWKPKVLLDDGLRRTVAWYREQTKGADE